MHSALHAHAFFLLVQIVTAMVLPRLLGPAQLGTYLLSASICHLASLSASLGTQDLLERAIGVRSPLILGKVMAIRMSYFAVYLLGSCVFFLFFPRSELTWLGWATLIGSAAIRVLNDFRLSLLMGEERFRTNRFLESARPCLRVLGIALAVWLRQVSHLSISLTFLISETVFFVACRKLVPNTTRVSIKGWWSSNERNPFVSWHWLSGSTLYSLLFVASCEAPFITYAFLSNSLEEAGHFGVAWKVTLFIQSLLQFRTRILLPSLQRAEGIDKASESVRRLGFISISNLILVALVWLVNQTARGFIWRLAFGTLYSDLSQLMTKTLPVVIGWSALYPIDQLWLTRGKSRVPATYYLVVLASAFGVAFFTHRHLMLSLAVGFGAVLAMNALYYSLPDSLRGRWLERLFQ